MLGVEEIALDITASWIRMLLALGLSIVFALTVGIAAARNKRAEGIVIPLLDVFQSIPILGFFPLIIYGIYGLIPNEIGASLAIIILIFTSMSWNIAFGVYEAVKAIPQDYADLLDVSRASTWQRIRSLYIPASLSRIAYNTQISWAVGLFYLVSSEIISEGTKTVPVAYGIGIGAMNFTAAGDFTDYALCIVGLIVTVVVWRFVFLREFALWSERYKMMEEPREIHRDPIMRFYSWVNHRSISKLFLLAHGRGVDRFTSSLYRFRRGIKYALVISIGFFLLLELAAMGRGGISFALPPSSTVLSTEFYVLVGLGASFLRVWYVWAICVAIGLPLGIVVSLNFKLYDTVSPILEVISSVPAPILLPVLVLIPFIGSSGEAIAAIVIILGIFWYIVFNVMAGVRTLPDDLKSLPATFHVGRRSAWKNVYIPGAMTALVTGSITAVGGAWNTLIVAEYFTRTNPDGSKTLLTQVGTGIGKIITQATNSADGLTLTLAVVSMTVLIVVFNLTVWRRVYHHVTRRYAYNR
ncbi:MAG TPA: ABC transporter permease subunit [Nitrososphaerales archaeon]|nr:ABC transporter permease subunit [Nitrososphaerales archaeon]